MCKWPSVCEFPQKPGAYHLCPPAGLNDTLLYFWRLTLVSPTPPTAARGHALVVDSPMYEQPNLSCSIYQQEPMGKTLVHRAKMVEVAPKEGEPESVLAAVLPRSVVVKGTFQVLEVAACRCLVAVCVSPLLVAYRSVYQLSPVFSKTPLRNYALFAVYRF